MRWVLCVLICACSATPKATEPPAPNPDLDVLERAYRTLHPGLLRYNTPAELDALFAAARTDRAHPYLVLARLTAALRCGHSYPNPSNQTKEIEAQLVGGPRLPFWFRWIDRQLVVTRDFSGKLAPGDVIDAIGGVPARDVLAALLPFARADGHNDAARIAQLAITGASNHEAFDVLSPLVFPAWYAEPGVALTVNGKRVVVALAPRETAPVTDGPLWTPERRGDVLYVKMPTWVAYKTTWDWKSSLDEIAATDARALILDLRGNEGGTMIGDEIAAHLIDQPLARTTLAKRVRFASVPADLRPYLDTWDPSFFELGAEARDIGGGWRELAAAGEETIAPRAPRYRGKVIVLVDGANSSATFQFAQLAQRAKLATLVGAPTGGNQRGINGNAYFFVRLPVSKLEVDLPLVGMFADAPDAGLTPDVVVEESPADLAAGRDVTLIRSLELVR